MFDKLLGCFFTGVLCRASSAVPSSGPSQTTVMHKIGHGGTHFTSWAQKLREREVDSGVPALSYSPSGKRLVCAVGTKVCVLNAASLSIEVEIEAAHGAGHVRDVSFVGSDTVIVTAGDDFVVRTWHCSATTATQANAFEASNATAPATACSIAWAVCAGRLILAVGYADSRVRLWELGSGSCIGTLEGHSGPVLGVAISRDGQWLASASEDGSANLWRLPDGAYIRTLRARTNAGAFVRLRFGTVRSSHMLAVASSNGLAHVFDLSGLTPSTAGRTSASTSASTRPSGKPPASVGEPSDGEGKAARREGGEAPSGIIAPVATLRGHSGGIRDLAIGENGEVLATASQDKTIRLWKLRSGEHCRVLPGGNDVLSLAFSSSGSAKLAAATAKGSVKVFGIVPRGGEAGMMRPAAPRYGV
jgi:WD40 repeat protein